jgi:hypothetical protein
MRFHRSLAAIGLMTMASAVACGPLPEDDAPPATAASIAPRPPDQTVLVDPNADVYADTDPSAVTDFHTVLDAHGQWVEDPTYGTVWVPSAAEVGPDFAPYRTAGYWAYDEDDYVWYSDYDWGWAPFHYGRWVYGGLGWVWIPGRVYAPAWVSWRFGGPEYAYVGWAPMAPGFYWRGGVAVALAPTIIAPGGFYYCGHGDLFSRSLSAHVVARAEAGGIGQHTTAFRAAAGGVGRGPAPASMGIAPAAITHGPVGDRGMQMAKGFARPSTAKAMGGHGPTPHKVVAAPHPRAAGAARGVRGGSGGARRR